MAKSKKMPPKKGKGVDVMIAVAPAGKMGGGKKPPPPFAKAKSKDGGVCPDCGGPIKNGVCQSCGYKMK